MANITNTSVYVNFTNMANYNNSINIDTSFINDNWNNILLEIFEIFQKYPIIEWFVTIMAFILLFLILKKILNTTSFQKTDIQILSLTSFIIIVFNTLLLIFNIFTLLKPLELFVIIWLISTIPLLLKNR